MSACEGCGLGISCRVPLWILDKFGCLVISDYFERQVNKPSSTSPAAIITTTSSRFRGSKYYCGDGGGGGEEGNGERMPLAGKIKNFLGSRSGAWIPRRLSVKRAYDTIHTTLTLSGVRRNGGKV